MLDNFCAFILTHGRPENVITYNTLRIQGYTGPIRLIIDNEDKTADEYYKKYSDEVIMFDKKAVSFTFDAGDNFDFRKMIVYARNACFEIAEQLGFKYFVQLDDDYTDFRYKQDQYGNFINRSLIKNLDAIFSLLLNYYKNIPALSVAIAQGGDFLGGKNGNAHAHPQFRKLMNFFILSTERPFKFVGKVNDDVNIYTEAGRRGKLFLTIPNIALQQETSQANASGATDFYKKFGTYVKSFTSVMYAPSCVTVKMMISNHPRLHHSVSWPHACPVIIREKWKKNNAPI